MAKKVKKSKQYRKPAQFANVAPAPPAARTGRTAAQAQSNAMILISAGLVTSVLLFAYYHLLTMNQLTELSEGLAMPDQRILGYSVEDITALRGVMNGEDVAQLIYLHGTVGVFFPVLFGLFSLMVLNQWVTTRKRRWLAWSAPLLFVVVDLWENKVIDSLFAGELDSSTVVLASTLTIVRWLLLIITAITIGIIGVRRFRAKFKLKWAEATEDQ